MSAMMAADALGANSYEVLKYGDTGDATGDKSAVVGYLSVAIYRRPLVLDEFEKTRLLEIARKTLTSVLSGGTKPEFMIYEKELQQRSGVFVTLTTTMDGSLRGCIGYIKPVEPLYLAVSNMAISAATQDTRFTPVTSQELPGLNIEISVISPMTKMISKKDIIIGKHGLFIVNGGQSGLLLPQVATEQHWNEDEFLRQVCLKAGLDPAVLLEPNTQVYTFTADVFREEQ
jgi:AmmeMemoRadiSam system protein A